MRVLPRRHAFGESFWWIPMGYALNALAFGMLLPRLEVHFFPGQVSAVSADAAIAIYSSVASGMMALTGIVFSLAFVMMQFNATAYSPRLPRHRGLHRHLHLRPLRAGLGGPHPLRQCPPDDLVVRGGAGGG